MQTVIPVTEHPLDTLVEPLARFLTQEILEDEDIFLEASTPLLQLGIIDSLTMVSLLGFIESEFGVMVPNEAVIPDNLETLTAIAQLINRLKDQQASSTAEHSQIKESHSLDETLRVLETVGLQRQITPLQQGDITSHIHTLQVSSNGVTQEQTAQQPTWILLPGLGNPSTSWSTLLRSQMDSQTSIAIDLAGFGLSTTSQSTPTYQDHFDYILHLLPTLAPPPYVLVGSSAGAMIATEIVRRHPDWVKALVVTGFGLIQDVPNWWQRLLVLAEDPNHFLQAAYHRPPKLTSTLKALIEDVLNRPAYGSFLQGSGMDAMVHTFDDIQIPTLFIAGQDDQIIPPSAVQAAAARIPEARIEWLARCGHFPPVEQPEEVLYLIQAFLQDLA